MYISEILSYSLKFGKSLILGQYLESLLSIPYHTKNQPIKLLSINQALLS